MSSSPGEAPMADSAHRALRRLAVQPPTASRSVRGGLRADLLTVFPATKRALVLTCTLPANARESRPGDEPAAARAYRSPLAVACTCPEARPADFGDFQPAAVGALLIGSIPGVILVAFAPSRVPGSRSTGHMPWCCWPRTQILGVSAPDAITRATHARSWLCEVLRVRHRRSHLTACSAVNLRR